MRTFPDWHFVDKGDFPENYPDNITYSYQCNEYSYPVLIIVKSNYNCYKAVRARFTNEENFKWWAAKGVSKPPKFKDKDVICWTFLPSKEYVDDYLMKLKSNETDKLP